MKTLLPPALIALALALQPAAAAGCGGAGAPSVGIFQLNTGVGTYYVDDRGTDGLWVYEETSVVDPAGAVHSYNPGDCDDLGLVCDPCVDTRPGIVLDRLVAGLPGA